MPYAVTIVCLANSRKTSGRCVAGKVIDGQRFGPWVRPISNRPTEEVSEEERRYEDGTDPRLGDIVRVPMLEHCPSAHQTENHLIDANEHWEKVGRVSWDDCIRAVDNAQGPLWINGFSTYNGLSDQIPAHEVRGITDSLRLIGPLPLRLQVGVEGGVVAPAKRKVRGEFEFNGSRYRLAVTDPVIERAYLGRGIGAYDLDQALLCVSLGDVWNGNAYKFVAAVLTPDREG